MRKFIAIWLCTILIFPARLAFAQQASETSRPARGVIDEIIVTVTKREQSLQDVGASVTAFDGRMIERANIDDPFKLAEMTPGVVTRGRENITIRGIGTDLIGIPPVAFHENGVFIFNNNVGGSYYDLATIELLRGPSGTVYGRNATAGALNLRWSPPVDEWKVKLDARAAGLKEKRYRGVLNVPLLPRGLLNARLVYTHEERDGLLDNLESQNKRFDGDIKDDQTARLWLQSQPVDNLLINLRYKTFERDQYRISSPTALTRSNGSLEEFGAQPLPRDLTKVRARAHEMIFTDTARDLFGEKGFDDYAITFDRIDAELIWSLENLPLLGDIDLTVLGAKHNGDAFRAMDIDGTEAPIVDRLSREKEDFDVAEIRLSSQNDGAFSWIAGYFRASQTQDNRSLAFVRAKADLIEAQSGISTGLDTGTILELDVSTPLSRERVQSEAFFVSGELRLQSLWEPLPNAELFGGIRINRDEQRIREHNVRRLLLPDRQNQTTGATITDSEESFNVSFREPTGELGLKWFPGDDFMLYAKYARGYKNGFGEIMDDGALNEIEAEQLDAYEIGSKNRFFDGMLQMNAVAFYYDYANLQVQQIRETQQVTENAAEARLYGLEVDFSLAPTARLFSTLSLGYLKGQFKDFCSQDPAFPSLSDPGCAAGEQNLRGNDMQDTPRYKVSALLSYSYPLGRFGSLQAVAKSTWTDSYFLRHYNRPDVDRQESFSKTDLRLVWTSTGERFSVDAFVENLENKDQIFFRPIPLGLGVEGIITSLGPSSPRMFGAMVSFRY